jgi:hypothetical protein
MNPKGIRRKHSVLEMSWRRNGALCAGTEHFVVIRRKAVIEYETVTGRNGERSIVHPNGIIIRFHPVR